MNAIELASILTPLGGALGGLAAAGGRSPALLLVGAVSGFVTGALVHPGAMLLGSKLADLRDRSSQHAEARQARSTPWWVWAMLVRWHRQFSERFSRASR